MFQANQKHKVAVIGSGISGISSAWFLSQKHDVTLFEKESTLGGHTNTRDVQLVNGEKTAVDTGFIVYNEPNYPLLTAMFDHLKVATYPTNMSFAVSVDQGRLEYAGSNLAENSYKGTAGDVVGPAYGKSAGAAFNWQYTLDLPYKNSSIHVKFDDWMFLQTDKVMLNKAKVTKWGFTVGEVTLFFTKDD